MTEAHEMAEKISESGEEHEHHHVGADLFRRRVGVLIGALACALAITSVGGSKAMKETINANIETSDHYAFYQAKYVRRSVLQTASDQIDQTLADPATTGEAGQKLRDRQAKYAADIKKLESSPDKMNGMKELLDQAHESEERRATAAEKDESFELAEALLQISVVLASTAVLMASRPLLLACLGFASLGLLGTINGYFALFPLPFGH